MNHNDIEKLVKQIQGEMNKIEEALKMIDENVSLISDGKCWNGDHAYDSVKTLLTQVDCNRSLLTN